MCAPEIRAGNYKNGGLGSFHGFRVLSGSHLALQNTHISERYWNGLEKLRLGCNRFTVNRRPKMGRV